MHPFTSRRIESTQIQNQYARWCSPFTSRCVWFAFTRHAIAADLIRETANVRNKCFSVGRGTLRVRCEATRSQTSGNEMGCAIAIVCRVVPVAPKGPVCVLLKAVCVELQTNGPPSQFHFASIPFERLSLLTSSNVSYAPHPVVAKMFRLCEQDPTDTYAQLYIDASVSRKSRPDHFFPLNGSGRSSVIDSNEKPPPEKKKDSKTSTECMRLIRSASLVPPIN